MGANCDAGNPYAHAPMSFLFFLAVMAALAALAVQFVYLFFLFLASWRLGGSIFF
jgi:hypothetical protein